MFSFCVTSLSSASFIPVTSCISSIHFLLGRPILLLPSPCSSIIPFSNPSDRITGPRILAFFLALFVVAFHLLLLQSPCVHFHWSFSPSMIFFASSSISTSHVHT